jgi:hypothetical protein
VPGLNAPSTKRIVARLRRELVGALPVGSGQRELPSYLIVGTKRGGTSSLHEYVVQHPDVRRALTVKGTRYFDVRFDRGWDWFVKQFPTTKSLDKAQAANNGVRPLLGDASPYYCFHPEAVGRIADRLPNARLILLVREPVARAWSHYNYEKARDRETRTFRDALDREEDRLRDGDGEHSAEYCHRHFGYRARGHYAEQVERILQHFPREQLLVMESEKLFSEPQAAMDDVFAFCGLAPYVGDFTETVKGNSYKGIEPDVRAELDRYFEPQNAALEALLGRPFWQSEQ